MKRFNLRQIFLCMSAAGLMSVCNSATAAAFQLWELDAASIGNYHAGTAASADDASTAMYNPAGLVRLKNQQLIVGADPVLTDFRYRGTVQVNTLGPAVQNATAQGGGFNIVPFGHYAAPISDRVAFGMSIDVPFGLKTNYGTQSVTRYAATLTELKVVDYSPSLAVALTDKLSMGLGIDIQHLDAQFNLFATARVPGVPTPLDTESNNSSSNTAYGYRLGALYQFNQFTRAGINFRSKVTHHTSGTSKFEGPLAVGGFQESTHFKATATLPSITSLSLFHTYNPTWDFMGSVTYVQWSVFKNLVLQNVAGVNASRMHTDSLVVDIYQHYRDTWNFSVGTNYHPNDQWIFRTGIGFDQTPSSNTYRNLQLPDSDRIALAVGAHYQATKTIGFDAGWTHIFAMNTRINNLTQAIGPENVTLNGSVNSSADVFGLQLKWDIV